MEKQTNKIARFISKCIIFLLGMMRICTSCSEPKIAYGSPSAEYDFKGTITDENGLPLENVKVKLFLMDKEEAYISMESDINKFKADILEGNPDGRNLSATNEEGEYSLSDETRRPRNFTLFYLKEGYEIRDTSFSWKELVIKGKATWAHEGKCAATIDIVLKREESKD